MTPQRSPARRWLRDLLIGTVFAMVLLLVAFAGRASAGQYFAVQCYPQQGGNIDSAFFYNQGAGFTPYNLCPPAQGGLGFGLYGAGGAINGAYGKWEIRAPAGVTLSRMEWLGLGKSQNGWQPHFFAISAAGDYIDLQFGFDGSERWTTVSDPRIGWAQMLKCDSPGCGGAPGARINARYLQFTAQDTSPPRVDSASGTLYDPGPRRGSQSLSVATSDTGAGVRQIWLRVNGVDLPGQWIGCYLNGDGTVAQTLTPCPSAGSADFAVDTEAYPFRDGANAVEVCVSDLSTIGNESIACPPQFARTVQVDNSCDRSSVGGGAALSAQFTDTHGRQRVVVSSNRDATVIGRLTDANGAAVARAKLCVREQTLLPNTAPVGVGTLRTDGNGYYRYRVQAGPNREVTVAYRDGSRQIERAVQYFARAKPTLRLFPRRLDNGDATRFWGKLPGPGGEKRVVILQARYPGRRQWKTFQKARTDRSARFGVRYRFTSTFQTTTYRMRAIVPEQNSYPFLKGRSRAKRVTVRGG